MTVLDTEMAQLVVDLLTEFGTPVTITRYSSSVMSTTTTGVQLASAAEQSQTVRIAPPEAVSGFLQGEKQRSEDLMTLMASQGLVWVPAIGDRLVWLGQTYTLRDVVPLVTGDAIAAYEVRLRRGVE
jgi:hypothetical protein